MNTINEYNKFNTVIINQRRTIYRGVYIRCMNNESIFASLPSSNVKRKMTITPEFPRNNRHFSSFLNVIMHSQCYNDFNFLYIFSTNLHTYFMLYDDNHACVDCALCPIKIKTWSSLVFQEFKVIQKHII